ncbi:MAG: glycosyltransferase family 2 protein [Elusimicrobia bacterium]|nr:glycosyltransferase family 2 protein [Elusimicrobiota bacterium]
MTPPRVSVVIVTHDSGQVLPRCLKALAAQTLRAGSVVLVDSGSASTGYLEAAGTAHGAVVARMAKNIGFSAGNNEGTRLSGPGDYLLYLNPDVFLDEGFLAEAAAFMEEPARRRVGCLTGTLLGYDLAADRPSGLVDSTGLCRTWYGRWFDRGQGEAEENVPAAGAGSVPAVCGALMFCRREALDRVALPGGRVFDESFFMHKEDLDLSLRLREDGWDLVHHPGLKAYHCRGWDRSRRRVPRAMRLMAAANEVALYRKHPSPYIVWALAKRLLVAGLDL